MVPQNDFTPHGYLDNPYHSWKLNPSGVIRSQEPLGMGWHVPNLGSYVRNQFQYTAHLMPGIRIGETVLVTARDFEGVGAQIVSQIHTKNRFEYSCHLPGYHLSIKARYFLIQEHMLGCIVQLRNSGDEDMSMDCLFLHQHTHNPTTSRLWEHGLYMKAGLQEGSAMLGIASEGDVFVHGARAADGKPLQFHEPGLVSELEEVAGWVRGEVVRYPEVTEREEGSGWQKRVVIVAGQIVLQAGEERRMNMVLARGVSQDEAWKRWEDGLEEIAMAEMQHREDDEQFWKKAPQLRGDWPESWKRGFVYDLETLRMVMRPSAGVIEHVFDGMQIQAPRTVLAEAAMDSLFLSYADTQLAAEVLRGHFSSAPHANIPCMREDGSYNMVADDGQICGTAPEWGFPLWCCEQIYRRTGDRFWLRQVYPHAAGYLRWWLEKRTDQEGWLVYNCSWESGQDVSSRFGPQQTGGSVIEHIRPVDLQASMAQGAAILARWAEMLKDQPGSAGEDFVAEAEWWQRIANEFTVKTRKMWQEGWFRDYDTGTKEWSSQQDTMHFAPIFCGVAGWGQIEQLKEWLQKPPAHSGWDALSWPPVLLTLLGACAGAEMEQEASEFAARFIEASYTSADSRHKDEEGGIPGITREYRRPVERGERGDSEYTSAGIEGYGWGAISIYALLRYLIGLREEEAGKVTIAPMIPQRLRREGAVYRVGPLQWGRHELEISCHVLSAARYSIAVQCRLVPVDPKLAIFLDTSQVEIEEMVEQNWSWEGAWGEGRSLELPTKRPLA